ncbi:hypothetical protein, partial [Salmonella enterica]|uniref:hypothetical protein n=1 Tax=Salmonella enterica TaxID=28901 RepID=UPI0032B57727
QSGYPAFFKFSDSDKAIVIQSPCDGLAKAIQHYRGNSVNAKKSDVSLEKMQTDFSVAVDSYAAIKDGGAMSGIHKPTPTCGKCG